MDGEESRGIPSEGWTAYPGGHLLAYDLKQGTFESFVTAPDHEGILSFNLDTAHDRGFFITWPTGIFYRYNYATHDLKSFGKTCASGEDGTGAQYRTVCRSIAVNPADGSAWYSTSEGYIDPMLKMITFVRGGKALVRLHFYATHPQTFCCGGPASADFVGEACEVIEKSEGIPQIYFTSCAGDGPSANTTMVRRVRRVK